MSLSILCFANVARNRQCSYVRWSEVMFIIKQAVISVSTTQQHVYNFRNSRHLKMHIGCRWMHLCIIWNRIKEGRYFPSLELAYYLTGVQFVSRIFLNIIVMFLCLYLLWQPVKIPLSHFLPYWTYFKLFKLLRV